MNTAEEILVVILAAALAVLLILAITIAVLVIRLMKSLQNIASKAESFADSAEKTADAFKNVVGQVSLIRFIQNVVGMVQKRTKKGDNKGE